MKTPTEFYLENDYKVIDIDGYYGGQCWDLFAKFCLEYCNKTFGCIETGYVIDLWNHFEEIGLNEYFVKVPNNQLQDGDWAIWTGPCMITSHSHIAMFREDSFNSGGGIFLTQNPNGNPNYTHLMWISYDGLVGGLRPKCYMQDKSIPQPVEANTKVDQLKVNCVDTMRVRLGHSTNDEIIGSALIGYYNIINSFIDDEYTWLEVEKDKWIALYPPYCEIQHAIIEESTIEIKNSEKEDEINNIETIELINQDKESILRWIIELIIKLIRRIKNGKNNK